MEFGAASFPEYERKGHILGVSGESRVDDVGEERLVADVDESEEREDLVPYIITVINKEVLETL